MTFMFSAIQWRVSMKVFGLTVLVVAVFLSESKAAKMEEYQMITLDSGRYKVMWKYDMIKDYFYFNITVNATGWVAFGVSESFGNMMGYDVMIGGVRGMYMNETYYKDYLTTTRSMPFPDDMQDIMLTSAMEMDGYTNLVFHRKRKTADTAKDVEIKPGMMYLVWAYHNTYDVNATTGTFMRHTARGGMKSTFIDGKYTIVQLNDKYRLYWAYDNTTDMFYFTVVVKATGWIAFGVSTQRGGMKGYDVMVGGVDVMGNGYIGDYLTSTTSKPPKDAVQNYDLTTYEQRDGYTLLGFHRMRNTGDSSDVEIKPGKMNIVWAYHDSADVDGGDFGRHSQRGGMEYIFIQDTSGGGGDGGKGSSAMCYPSIFGIIALLLFQRVIGA